MNRRTLSFAAISVPVASLMALLVWALVQSEGNPGGLGVNEALGEVVVGRGPAPPLVLPLLGGGEIDIADLRGKVVMVDFWNSWCPPCIEEAPALEATYRKYAGQDVEFLGVAIWDEESEIERHVRRFGVTYPNGVDVRGTLTINYGVRGIPEKFFIDREGLLVRKFVGPMTEEDLEGILEELLEPLS